MSLILSACGNEEKEELHTCDFSNDKKTILKTESFTYDGLSSYHDLVSTDEGYLLFADLDMETVMLTLDPALNEVKRETLAERAFAFAWHENALYTLVEDGIVLKNGEVMYSNMQGYNMKVLPDGVYTYQESEQTDHFCKDGKMIPLPEPSPYYRNMIMDVRRENDETVLLLTEIPESEELIDNYQLTAAYIIYRVKGDAVEKVKEIEKEEALLISENGHGKISYNLGSFFTLPNGRKVTYEEIHIHSKTRKALLPADEDGALILCDDELFLIREEEADEKAAEPSLDGAEEKKIVILCYGESVDIDLSKYLEKFQREYPDYVVGIDYQEDANGLNRALLSNSFDMVISNRGIDVFRRLARQEFLDDVREYLPEEIGNDLYDCVIKAGTTSDILAAIPFTYTISGMVLPKSVLEEHGDFKDIIDLENTLDSLSDQRSWKVTTREEALREMGWDDFYQWVDLEEGTCAFEDETFYTFLHMLKRFAPDQDMVDANYRGNQELFRTGWTLHGCSADEDMMGMFYEHQKSGVPYSEYGLEGEIFPMPGRDTGGIRMDSNDLIGVMKNAEHPESVRKLFEYLFSESVQKEVYILGNLVSTQYFSPVKHLMKAEMERYMDVNEAFYPGHYDTEEKRHAFMETTENYLSRADHYARNTESPVSDIVNEEAWRYLKDEITAERAAEYIQNRVMLYLEEQG